MKPWVLILLIYVALACFVPQIKWDLDITKRFLPDDPALVALDQERALFGPGEKLFLFVEWDKRPQLDKLIHDINQWQRELTQINDVLTLNSFLDVPAIEWTSLTDWKVVRLSEQVGRRGAIQSNTLALKHFFRRDGQGISLVLTVAEAVIQDQHRRNHLIDAIHRWIQKQAPPYHLQLAGPIAAQVKATRIGQVDAMRISLILGVLVIGLLYGFFRSIKAVLAIVGIGAINIACTFGIVGMTGWPISLFAPYACPVIFAVSLLDNIHFTYSYGARRLEGEPPSQARLHMLKDLRVPCFWTTLTTIVGFGSLIFSSIEQIRTFGALAAIGTAFALLSSLTLLPVLLEKIDPAIRTRINTWAYRLGRTRLSKRWLLVACLLIIAALPGLTQLKINPDFPRMFRANHPFTLEMEGIEQKWGGLTHISYLLSLKPGLEFTDPRVSERLRDFTYLLDKRPLISSISSPLDLLGNAAKQYRIQFDKQIDSKLMTKLLNEIVVGAGLPRPALLGGRTPPLQAWINPETRTLRLLARVRMMQPEAFPQFTRDLYGFQSNLTDLFEVQLSGWPLLYKNLETELLREFFKGFGIAFGAVALLLLVAFRSFKWWFLALGPNLLPLVIVLGALGYSGEGLSSGLLLAPGIALGLVVDDTIHFVMRLKQEWLRRGASRSVPTLNDAIQDSLRKTGSPIIITSLVLASGFATLFLSVFRGNSWLAGVMVAVILLALCADLLLLPLLLRLTSKSS